MRRQGMSKMTYGHNDAPWNFHWCEDIMIEECLWQKLV